MGTINKYVLDACCGGRMFWFDKQEPNTVYMDKRVANKGHRIRRPSHEVVPDVVGDFTAMPFNNDTYKLIVFDPPHITNLGPNSDFRKAYGGLDSNWRDLIKSGFEECWRVLEPGGTLVFKWNETSIPISEILTLAPAKPLFGTRCGKAMKSIWLVFFKAPGGKNGSGTGN